MNLYKIENIDKNLLVGIDLGYSEVKISIFDNNNLPFMIQSDKMFLSLFFIDENRNIFFGKEAWKKSLLNSEKKIFNIMDCILLEENLFLKEYQISSIQIFSKFLLFIKSELKKSYGIDFKYVVLSIPTSFDEKEKMFIKKSFSLASLEVLRVIYEPVSAAIFCGFHRVIEKNNILILDFGFGSLDISVIESKNGLFEILYSKNNKNLGGRYWDKIFCDFLVNEIYEKHNVDISNNKIVITQFLNEIEKARKSFFKEEEVHINLKNITKGLDEKPVSLNIKISKEKILKIYNTLIDSFKKELNDLFNNISIKTKDIKNILLVGGFSEIFKIKNIFNEAFNDENRSKCLFLPIESIACGNLIQALLMLQNVGNNFSLAVRLFDNEKFTLIHENFIIPFKSKNYFSTFKNRQEKIFLELFKVYSFAPEYNRKIGEIWIENIKKKKSGIPIIKLKIIIETDGILNILSFDENNKKLSENKVNFLDVF